MCIAAYEACRLLAHHVLHTARGSAKVDLGRLQHPRLQTLRGPRALHRRNGDSPRTYSMTTGCPFRRPAYREDDTLPDDLIPARCPRSCGDAQHNRHSVV